MDDVGDFDATELAVDLEFQGAVVIDVPSPRQGAGPSAYPPVRSHRWWSSAMSMAVFIDHLRGTIGPAQHGVELV